MLCTTKIQLQQSFSTPLGITRNMSPLCGKTLVDIDFRRKYNCMVVGIEDEKGNLQVTQAQRKFQAGERIWVVGEEADLAMLKMGI